MNLSGLSGAQAQKALAATVAVTCALALLTIGFLVGQPAAQRSPGAGEKARPSRAWLPFVAFLAVCALLLGNQLVVNAYILGTHGGDPAFVARYLGRGWFALAPTAPAVRWLAANLPSPWLRGPLAYSVLRVQAVLELPFALLAYLAVATLLDGGLGRQLVRSALLPLAAISFTFTFCLIELRLHNPWTQSDLCARWLAALAVLLAWGVWRLTTPKEPGALAAPRLGLVGLLAFFVGAAALGAIVLAMYDVALLYNLGHLRARWPILGAGVLLGTLAVLVRAASQSARPGPPGPGLQTLTSILAAFTAVFFAPALSIRYCGTRDSAVLGAALLFLVALGVGTWLAMRAVGSRGFPRWRVLLGLAVALLTALALTLSDVGRTIFGTSQPLFELVLLERAALIFPASALAVWLVDQLLPGAKPQPR